MAKGPIVSERVKNRIVEIYLEHPNWVGKEIYNQLCIELGDKSPGKSFVQKELTKIRREEKKIVSSNNINEPWHMGTIDRYPIPYEVIPRVLRISANHEYENEFMFKHTLSIRDVKWMARLSYLISDDETLKLWAKIYSFRESVNELSKKPNDTYDFDRVLNRDRKQSIYYFIKWLISTDLISESLKETIGKLSSYSIENKLLNRIDGDCKDYFLGGTNWLAYWHYLYLVNVQKEKWRNISKKKIIETVQQLRKWLVDNQDKPKDPLKILAEIGIDIKGTYELF